MFWCFCAFVSVNDELTEYAICCLSCIFFLHLSTACVTSLPLRHSSVLSCQHQHSSLCFGILCSFTGYPGQHDNLNFRLYTICHFCIVLSFTLIPVISVMFWNGFLLSFSPPWFNRICWAWYVILQAPLFLCLCVHILHSVLIIEYLFYVLLCIHLHSFCYLCPFPSSDDTKEPQADQDHADRPMEPLAEEELDEDAEADQERLKRVEPMTRNAISRPGRNFTSEQRDSIVIVYWAAQMLLSFVSLPVPLCFILSSYSSHSLLL